MILNILVILFVIILFLIINFSKYYKIRDYIYVEKIYKEFWNEKKYYVRNYEIKEKNNKRWINIGKYKLLYVMEYEIKWVIFEIRFNRFGKNERFDKYDKVIYRRKYRIK
jgi:hypothetical protein